MKQFNIKTLVAASVLSLAFMVTMAAFPTTASAQWFQVNNPDSHVDLRSRTHYGGKVYCRVRHGEKLRVPSNGRVPTYSSDGLYVYLAWMRKLGTMEWHWKDAHNKWCGHWHRTGWVELRLIEAINNPGGNWIN